MVKRRASYVIIALIVVAIAATVVYADLAAGTKAPTFTLPTVDGKTFTLSSCFKAPGKVTLLDLWATWCPPCRREIPYLIDLQKKFKGKDVMVVGVSLDAEKSTVANFVKAQGINYAIAHDPSGNKIGGLYQVKGIPATYVIDKKGVIRYAHSGFSGKDDAASIEKEINTLLAQK